MVNMSRWIHSDDHCPRRPLLGRVNGRRYRCRCGRVWEYRYRRGVISNLSTWILVK